MEKIAIVVDSGLNLNKDYIEKNDIFVLPLKVIHNDRVYLDGVDINSVQVCEMLKTDIPKTSLPSVSEISDMFDKVIEKGYSKIICIAIASALSGTYNAMRIVSEERTDIESYVIDTKNISIASGLIAKFAKKLVDLGQDYKKVIETVEKNIENARIFFMVDTLEYLRKGGRIGLVSFLLASKLNLKPIISCNENGVYHTVAKARGRKHAIEVMQKLAEKFCEGKKIYDLATVHFASLEDFGSFTDKILQMLPNSESFDTAEASPTLGIHTGPKALGIAVFAPEM